MTADERERLLLDLDEELLKGGVILSEWCVFIVRDADTAFVAGANLAVIILAASAIETYLRSEYSKGKRQRLVDLINNSPIDATLKSDIHVLRIYRNKWVHASDPWDDELLLDATEKQDSEIENMARFAVRTLRRTLYENQWV